MARLTIRDLEDDVKERLRVLAARHGHSMEEEVREILRRSVRGPTGAQFLEMMQAAVPPALRADLPVPERSSRRGVATFDDDT